VPIDGGTSVSRTIGLSPEDAIWRHAQDDVRAHRTGPESLKGRADLVASQIVDNDLKIESCPTPENNRHAEIQDWPVGDEDMIATAKELAFIASFVRLPK